MEQIVIGLHYAFQVPPQRRRVKTLSELFDLLMRRAALVILLLQLFKQLVCLFHNFPPLLRGAAAELDRLAPEVGGGAADARPRRRLRTCSFVVGGNDGVWCLRLLLRKLKLLLLGRTRYIVGLQVRASRPTKKRGERCILRKLAGLNGRSHADTLIPGDIVVEELDQRIDDANAYNLIFRDRSACCVQLLQLRKLLRRFKFLLSILMSYRSAVLTMHNSSLLGN